MLIHPPNIDFPGVRAFFTTRIFSEGQKDLVAAVAGYLHISGDDIYVPVQKHTSDVFVLRDVADPDVADAVVTDRKGVMIGILVADCVPILLIDRKNDALGAVHAGWRGTAEKILIRTVQEMQREFGSEPQDIQAAIGPCIQKCSYEVGEDVRERVKKATGSGAYIVQSGGGFSLDLSDANRIQAITAGISTDHIWQSPDCTYCNPDKYYSYRYSRERAGRQGAFIGMW